MLVFSCKEKEFDSPYISIESPMKKQSVAGSDSVRIRATITPSDSSVANWRIMVQDKKGSDIYAATGYCECKGKQPLDIERAFAYPVNKTTDMVMTICANFTNGTEACETVRFEVTK
ncbi:hypothetical protein GCM10010967_36370 [Dyadobacter beijingensis]|uniref:Uncharacterized protein n=2 Tax=Dyadobacter beijingensis TaxID=365489 RepID=A0ABQ2I483_9BACT|nr:hypothetical protein GCM10010967_36370 [Dyadobacter beijingensis]